MATGEHLSSAVHSSTGTPPGDELSRWPQLVGLVLLSFSLGYFLLGPIGPGRLQTGSISKPGRTSLLPSKPLDLLLPSEGLSPAQVVSSQMGALATYRKDRRAIHQVFAFASPANQSVTGPLSHFEQMILRSPYDSMVASDHWMAGRVVQHDRMATVLVTTVDAQGKLSLFRFYLSRQEETYPRCWMTDRVICLFQGGLNSDDGFRIDSPFVNGI